MKPERQIANRYIARIRNEEKRRYATDYAQHLIGLYGEPDSTTYNVSYMAKQGVRMELIKILRPEH